MRIKRKHKFKNNKKERRIKSRSITPIRKRWSAKRKSFSEYPYVITVSMFRRNVFFNAANFKGQTKIWLNSGKCGFKGRNKIEYLALTSVAEIFFRRVWIFGIRRAIFRYKNFNRKRWAIRKALRRTLRRCPIKILGFFIETQIAFNGCRRKKKRRK